MEPKSGAKTSEFYMTVISMVVGAGVTVGVVPPELSDPLIKGLQLLVLAIVTLGPVWVYVHNRTVLKQAALDAQLEKNTP